MARPIADTPTLRGMEALRFMQEMENAKPSFSAERKAEMERHYEWFKSIAVNFTL